MEMDTRKEKTKIGFHAPRFGKTDSARWRDSKFKPLTYAQDRIKTLCEGFLKGQVTSEEFKRELPPILNARDREKRSLHS
jgi:hypothetical protein